MQLEKIIQERRWPRTTLFIPFGSRVYGTARPDSDHDYLVVFPENNGPLGLELAFENTNLQTLTRTRFRRSFASARPKSEATRTHHTHPAEPTRLVPRHPSSGQGGFGIILCGTHRAKPALQKSAYWMT